MHALKTFRAHGLEKKETDAFISLSNSAARAFTRMSLVGTYIRPVNDAALLIIIAILIWFSSAIDNPVAITATVIAMLYKLQPYVFSMEGSLMTLVKSQGPLDAIIEQLQAKDIYPETAYETKPVPAHWHKLRFHNVCFQYEDEPIINCLSFELLRGKVIAIKGSSGAGKSTLVNLILKLIHPTSGKIWLDDQNFKFIDRRDWLSTVAAAGQDFELLDGTLRENLTFGRKASDEELYEALAIAEIKDFIETLPEGLQTRMGERGVRLSGGQKQRIMLARALVSNPEILIMDEATSAVSLDIEERIYNNIKSSRPGITLILITHRNIFSEFVDVTVEIPSQTHFQAQKSVCNA
jgi:ABC-type multidrug transport system fused ATPase/permease subunit